MLENMYISQHQCVSTKCLYGLEAVRDCNVYYYYCDKNYNNNT